MMTIDQLLDEARNLGASDVHLTKGLPPMLRRNGELIPYGESLGDDAIEQWIMALPSAKQRQMLMAGQDVDFAYCADNGTGHRINIYRQKGAYCAAIRLLQDTVPTIDQLNLPPILKEMALLPRGLVVITGSAGSGKSTTLAAMIDYINSSRRCHILTIEDPIEYNHIHKRSMVNQRELGSDVPSYSLALRAALREDPDVIMLGEMRDLDTISAALTAAETGHLVLSTLHTIGAANTVDRIIDVFGAAHQQQIRMQLASVLKGVATQLLLPTADDSGRAAAFEIMVTTDAISHLIRENKVHQINSAIQTGGRLGMRTLDADLADLVNRGICTLEDAQSRMIDQESFQRFLQNNSLNPFGRF